MAHIFPEIAHLIFDSIVILLVIILPVVLYTAYKKFLKGELSNIIKWLLYASIFLFLYKLIEEAMEWLSFSESISELFEYGEYVFFILLILAFLRIVLLVYKFANIYGFKEISKPEKYFGGKK